MARITVEDCFKMLDNKFELVVLAGYRAKEVSKGAPIKIERNNDKDSVLALREMAGGYQDINKLKQLYVQSLQLNIQNDDQPEEDTVVSEEEEDQSDILADSEASEDLIESDFVSIDEEDDFVEDLEDDMGDGDSDDK